MDDRFISDYLWDSFLRAEELSLLSKTPVTLTMQEFHAIMEELRRGYNNMEELGILYKNWKEGRDG